MKKIFCKREFLRGMLVAAISVVLFAGCGKKDDPITQAEKKDVAKGVAAPGIAEIKTIAEEAFIYGLPIVTNSAVMYEFAVNKGGRQFKAPFNEIQNQARVITYKDTGVGES